MSQLDQVLQRIDSDLDSSLERLFQWLKVPSISTDPAYKDHCRTAGQWLVDELKSIGVEASLRETGGHPAVVGHAKSDAKLHVLFYGHYDVQPVDPLELWETPPFEPRMITLPDGRKAISARGSSDDKGQVMTFVEACRAWKSETGSLPINITFLVEGAEEDGSKFLPEFIEANKAELKADVALVCDTGMWDQNTPGITSSLRGMVYEEIIVRCADRDLHSGAFGGAARNPIHVLSKIIAAFHDDNGRITIPGFYDGVHETPTQVLEQWKGLNLTEEEFLGQVGLKNSAGEKGRMLIEQIQSRPTCDVNGIIGGYTGEGTKTVIAAEARCKVSFRLVGDQDPVAISKNFEAFVRERIPADCSVEFIHHKGSRALALPHDFPAITAAKSALHDEWQKDPIVIGMGGSIPVGGDFKRTLGMDTLFVGFGLDDDRIHSPNEKYDLKSFHKGTRSWARILAAMAK
ncbi:acetylornithine deacetylase/succinyl-diaminopimelate desuccinylase-like protein [Microvirga lupini]|uniref:Acetylornithine deacetylase/succinyl-diaminopimelate desuccinylase-like protein n=1 Tax=Microvirga lupini TaxID=420324 RepID=A0A7W4VK40_9HYPH|nr:M20/M25/M40 family metallo-hydrolase [Microvirga lupini]MBB3018657.1 acetylornithine deacetylase/succinyl-diaminopimelate desuccinylase-like protein [Microvirga lupini]